jgi:uncharacterized protein (DUF488 family)
VTIWTIGHSTRALDELVKLLQESRIELLADVRTAPGSRRLPHFGKASLEIELPARGVDYVHLPALGGLRKPLPASTNTGWRNPSFRGYADYMQTPEFEAGLAELARLAGERRTSLMCAEAVPWRCHRSLIADVLTVRGVEVLHITGRGRVQPHVLTSFVQVEDGCVVYPDTLGLDGGAAGKLDPNIR